MYRLSSTAMIAFFIAGYLLRLEDNRAPTVRVPSRCRPRHHHLRSGDEDAEVLALQVPNRCKLGRTAVRWRGHPTQEHSANTRFASTICSPPANQGTTGTKLCAGRAFYKG